MTFLWLELLKIIYKIDTQSTSNKLKVGKLACTKIKNLQGWNDKPGYKREYLQIISGKKLVSRIVEELLQLINKKSNVIKYVHIHIQFFLVVSK